MIAALAVTEADASVYVAALAAVAAICGTWFGYLGVKASRSSRDAAQRAEAATKPNGGHSLEDGGTLADSLVRIEARVAEHSAFTAEQFEAVREKLRAGGERMARLEATATGTREDVAGLRSALGAEAQRRAGVEARLSDHIDDHHRGEGDHR